MVLDKEASNLAAGYVIEERKHFPNTLGRVRILATPIHNWPSEMPFFFT